MSIYTTKEIADKVRPIARAYGIDKMYIFGSYARGEATDSSDIDFYVEFSKPLGLRYCSFFSDIEESMGKSIDIITKDGLYNPVTLNANGPLIQRIMEERKCIYE
ncbi:MAG: nucleotidyltransferase family protein [Oscillospiraceae bacterium]